MEWTKAWSECGPLAPRGGRKQKRRCKFRLRGIFVWGSHPSVIINWKRKQVSEESASQSPWLDFTCRAGWTMDMCGPQRGASQWDGWAPGQSNQDFAYHLVDHECTRHQAREHLDWVNPLDCFSNFRGEQAFLSIGTQRGLGLGAYFEPRTKRTCIRLPGLP